MENYYDQIERIMNERNNYGFLDFEGYAPIAMKYILLETFGDKSPIQLQKLTDSDYKLIPLLNQIKYLADLIGNIGELKLTSKGFLPPKVVADIYDQGFIKDEHIESGFSKLRKETDSLPINLTRIFIEISGLTKKRKNKLSLTKTGEKIASDNFELLRLIFNIFGFKFNWSYYNRYGENSIGQIGFGFSLILLSKYGFEKRLDNFYSEKYFKAFPQLIDNTPLSKFDTRTSEDRSANYYSYRTFERFLNYFGLINIDADKYITKTELFDKLINVRPYNRTETLARIEPVKSAPQTKDFTNFFQLGSK